MRSTTLVLILFAALACLPFVSEAKTIRYTFDLQDLEWNQTLPPIYEFNIVIENPELPDSILRHFSFVNKFSPNTGDEIPNIPVGMDYVSKYSKVRFSKNKIEIGIMIPTGGSRIIVLDLKENLASLQKPNIFNRRYFRKGINPYAPVKMNWHDVSRDHDENHAKNAMVWVLNGEGPTKYSAVADNLCTQLLKK